MRTVRREVDVLKERVRAQEEEVEAEEAEIRRAAEAGEEWEAETDWRRRMKQVWRDREEATGRGCGLRYRKRDQTYDKG